MSSFSSSQYWENRYASGGNSGAGSSGRLAVFKADFINAFVQLNQITRVIDFGCGDGTQLGLLTVPKYTGLDASSKALALCRAKFPQPNYTFVGYDELAEVKMADLVLSIDIIFHLVEDSVFEKYMRDIFLFATDYVIFYSSNYDSNWPTEHVRHRCVSDYMTRMFPEWALLAHVPNIYPYDAACPDSTSFADFLVYGRTRRGCRIRIPAAVEEGKNRSASLVSAVTSPDPRPTLQESSK